MTFTATADFAAAVAELLAVYAAEGFAAADRRCTALRADRGLTDSETLSLADAFRRRAVYA